MRLYHILFKFFCKLERTTHIIFCST